MADCLLGYGLPGPKGDTGPRGATGSTGPQGPSGISISFGTENTSLSTTNSTPLLRRYYFIIIESFTDFASGQTSVVIGRGNTTYYNSLSNQNSSMISLGTNGNDLRTYVNFNRVSGSIVATIFGAY